MDNVNGGLKILIVEDVPFDAELMQRELTKAGFVHTARCVETEEDFLHELKQFSPDLILSDYSMPRFNGMKALQLAKQHTPLTPFILVTGSINEMTAVECIKAGADDYVLKEHLTRLAPAVNDAFKRTRIAQEKEKAEKALRESEDMFRMITENISDLIAVVDLDGRRVYNSPSYRNMFGDPGLLRGTDSFDDIHPDDRERVRHVFNETIRTGEGRRAEYRFLLKDGSVRHIESIGAVVKGENGRPSRVVVVSRDVTDRKAREEELKIQKAYFEQLFESAPEGIIIRDAEGRVQQVNNEFLKMFGYTKDEVVGNRIMELIIPDGEPDEVFSLMKQKAFKENISIETARRCKDGRVVDVSILGAAIGVDGGDVAIYNMYRDISDRKRAELERENLISTLQEALSEVKLLSGLLPICAWCKKIRDDKGYYHQLEEYIGSHSEAEFTHGICPTCAAKYFSKNL